MNATETATRKSLEKLVKAEGLEAAVAVLA